MTPQEEIVSLWDKLTDAEKESFDRRLDCAIDAMTERTRRSLRARAKEVGLEEDEREMAYLLLLRSYFDPNRYSKSKKERVKLRYVKREVTYERNVIQRSGHNRR